MLPKPLDSRAVLDYGYVNLLNVTGDDSWIASGARMSNGADKVAKDEADDEHLIDYLWRNHHTSPFEHCSIMAEIKLPIFVARQLVRHRTGKLNEVSARYTPLPEEYYIPQDFHLKSNSMKQGRSDNVHEDSDFLKRAYQALMAQAFVLYREALNNDVAPEEARILLPLSTYTRWIWTMDLHNLMNLLTLRCDSHAQYEIRVYADALLEMIRPYFPQAIQAWENHTRHGIHLSRNEKQLLSNLAIEADLTLDGVDLRTIRILMEKLNK